MAGEMTRADFLDPEAEVVCPYDNSHRLLRKGLQYHLIKCRKNHPEKKYKICPFNATHHMPKAEMHRHLKVCPDKCLFNPEIEYAIRQENGALKGCTKLPVYNDVVFSSGEDWESEGGTTGFQQDVEYNMSVSPDIRPPARSVGCFLMGGAIGVGRGLNRGFRYGSVAASPGILVPNIENLPGQSKWMH